MIVKCGECDKEHKVWWIDTDQPDDGEVWVDCSCKGYDDVILAYREGEVE